MSGSNTQPTGQHVTITEAQIESIVRQLANALASSEQPASDRREVDPQDALRQVGLVLSDLGPQNVESFAGPVVMAQAEALIGGLLHSLANESHTSDAIRKVLNSAGGNGSAVKDNIGRIARQTAPTLVRALSKVLSVVANYPSQDAQRQPSARFAAAAIERGSYQSVGGTRNNGASERP